MKQAPRALIILSFLWAFLLLALGIWWSYLALVHRQSLPAPVARMLFWEGLSFLLLLVLLSSSLIFLYWRDLRKTRALQVFFASLTHELKTPLASIRLQGEVLDELAASTQDKKLMAPASRLVEDVQNLELQMDKLLQLSRTQLGGNLNLMPVDLVSVIEQEAKSMRSTHRLQLEAPKSSWVLADELALRMVFRNLFENSVHHSPDQKMHLTLKNDPSFLVVDYQDGGNFQGDPKKLGTLFYKHQSARGSGIGLYLTKRLMERMGGKWQPYYAPHFGHQLYFKKAARP